MSKSILLVGEPMGLFIAKDFGRLEDVSEFSLTTCGAEFNVAVGMKRLGHEVTYMTKLGNDPFGKKIVKMMNSTGISTDKIIYSQTNPTGFMFKSMVAEGDPSIFYFRKGSAASTLNSSDIQALDFLEYDIVHITGITPALTESTNNATYALLQKTREHRLTFSFDPNLRPQLWPSKNVMANCINDLAYKSDIFLPGINEVKTILGEGDPEKAAKHYLERGTKVVIIKLGADGAYYATSNESGYVKGYKVDTIVDTVGAGDGFASGVLSALRENLTLEEAVKRGNAIGAIQLMSKGDNDGLPTKEELIAFMANRKDWRKIHD